jgi:hypothetical protein
MPECNLRRVAVLATSWLVLTAIVLLADYIGVRVMHRDDLWGISVPMAFLVAPVVFGWPFHVSGSRHLLSYQALGIVLALTWVWGTCTTWLAMWFHVAVIGGELHL